MPVVFPPVGLIKNSRGVTRLVKIRICRMRILTFKIRQMRIVAFMLSVGTYCTALGQLNDCYNNVIS